MAVYIHHQHYLREMNLCKYKNMFGAPGEGVHSYRICDIAVVDVIATLGAAGALSTYFGAPCWQVFIALIILSIFVHVAFCVQTTLVKAIFSSQMISRESVLGSAHSAIAAGRGNIFKF
jgi:hypothetical protein